MNQILSLIYVIFLRIGIFLMNQQDLKRVFVALKDHISEYYGKGFLERYEIHSLPETGWDDANPALRGAQTINLDFTFDFFLLYSIQLILGSRKRNTLVYGF